MNQLLYEGRTLVGMVSSIIRQDTMHVLYNRLDWERMFRLADYHRVANVVYLSVLGKGDALPDRWRDRFFERYQEALLFGENCEESFRELLMWLDMREVSCTLLTSISMRELYKLPETAENTPVQILLDEENYLLAKGYLVDLGYETDQIYKGYGERMKRISGVSVILYHKLPFRTSGYIKNMQKILEDSYIREPYLNIRELPAESEFIFRMAKAVYGYVSDELRLREVLDLQIFHRAWREEINWEAVQKKLEDFQVDELGEKLLRISYMWFGDKKDNYFTDQPEDVTVYDILEDRLLTQGTINRESDMQALRLEKAIKKEIEREKRGEGRELYWEKITDSFRVFRKKLRWIFPDYHYMSSIYPMVERLPVLLPFFWGVRGVRLFFRLFIK
ncbi:MAG: nucleotidyltransferase family protein [Lachnospiraceae bacterium]|nr:nucleotidyltransferase family protein [Lachnospiraceae bacterium]